jgi:hypothetical protein
MGKAALGFKPRTGRAVLVTLALDGEPAVIDRAEVALLPPGEMAPYHAAEGLAPAAADRHVKEAVGRAQRLALEAIRDAVRRAQGAGHEVVACGVLVGSGMPHWTTGDILAVHVRMHKAEGEMFRDILVAAARGQGFKPATLPGKAALEAAARELGIARSKLDQRLAALGKAAGAPWGAHQKEAAAAALVALAAQSR